MATFIFSPLIVLSVDSVVRARMAGMLAVLAAGLLSGYIAASHLGLPRAWAKKILTFLLITFEWIIVLLVIWRLPLSMRLIWLPVIGVLQMLVVTGFSTVLFSQFRLERKSILTLILAGGLSNLGYTGGAIVCYAMFGTDGLSLANIYLIFWWPTVYLVFFPLLKLRELRRCDPDFKPALLNLWDSRMLVIPASLIAIALNISGVKTPSFIEGSHIIDILVYTASTLSFFSIGLLVHVSYIGLHKKLYFLLSFVKFILTPAVAFLLMWLLSLSGQGLSGPLPKIIIILSATPCAILMVTMSSVFELDDRLAGALWVVNTIAFAAVVVPVLFFLLH